MSTVKSPPVHYHKVSPEDSDSDKEVDLKDIENDNASIYSKERVCDMYHIYMYAGLF